MFEAKKCKFSIFEFVFIFSEPQNFLLTKIRSNVKMGFRVSIALKVVFADIGAHPEFLTLLYSLGFLWHWAEDFKTLENIFNDPN